MALTSDGSVNKGSATPEPGVQIERAQQQPERLPTAARPELRAVAKQSERSGGGGAPPKIARKPAAKSPDV